MRQYIRARVAGASYFFTLTLQQRSMRHLVEHADKLREAIAHVKAKHPFQIDAMVVLPDHLHAIWTLPEHDGDFATRWMLIKLRFSQGLEMPSRGSKGETSVWQRRYWEH